MDDRETGRYWERNAETWAPLARMGCDVYRDACNTPGFMAMLPDVAGLDGLDIGCGEGYNTRMAARRGVRMTALDIASTFLGYARQGECETPLGIRFLRGSGLALPFADGSFDFAMATMSLMDMPGHASVFAEVRRVLRPDGFFQFSICHPCFTTTRWKWVTDEEGRRVALECGDYFTRRNGELTELWMFGSAPEEYRTRVPHFEIPTFSRPISEWLNMLLDAGFAIERLGEPYPSDEALAAHPEIYDARIIAYFLHIRCRKNGR